MPTKIDSKNFLIGGIILLLMILIGGIFTLCKTFNKNITAENNCFIPSQKTVSGSSMMPVFSHGDVITSLIGYYDCNEIDRGDFVLADYGGASFDLVLKTVRGVPNDTFTLKQNGVGWNIIINDQVLMNHSGVAYSLPEYSANILKSYQHQSNGVVPEGKYLLFGEMIEGSYDSTKAGFFAREQIIAKVLPK